MAYLLDANAFIEAKKRWYGFDFCPAYWEWLEAANAAQSVFSIAPSSAASSGGWSWAPRR